ncbi:thiamine phosphate synthase [Gilvimarinus sp. F26214L]|uniref:thiamine phosphate synthase n=1 Tax=Gilvimarinus sp. DZF01 TaxID=3461371 RepID=UPI0040454054
MIQGLYAITNETLMPGELLLAKTEAALAGGCRLIQYRNKTASPAQQLREATALRSLCDEYGAALIINDSPQLAREAAAHGVHLGQEDGSLEAARRDLGSRMIVGATCHGSLELARQAALAGASYLAFGRFFPSQTKPQAPPATLDLIAEVHAEFGLPLVAIGGITLDNAAGLVAAGADCLAVSHDLFHGDPHQVRERALRYCSLFESTQESP